MKIPCNFCGVENEYNDNQWCKACRHEIGVPVGYCSCDQCRELAWKDNTAGRQDAGVDGLDKEYLPVSQR